MATVSITINNRTVSVPSGITVLKAAREIGIDIPTLCNHPALVPSGACRMCVVEIQGQRMLQTACTFPVAEGMDIQTESPRVVSARKLVLDMLFSERNHFCMFCEASGNCELQSMGYRYAIDHWVYPTYIKSFPLDGSHLRQVMDHNRCILCGRCVRGCNDQVANHTLGLRERGSQTMVHADSNIRWGESSCISCGTCLQVCPTGAIFEKRCAFMGRDTQTEHIKSTCSQCSVGCGIEVITRGGNVMRIKGDWEAPVNTGLLCRIGRYDPLQDPRKRITAPMIRRKGRLEPASWKEAINAAAKRFGEVQDRDAVGVLVSGQASNEALYLLERLFRQEFNVTNIGLLDKAAERVFEKQGTFSDIEKSDLILVVGTDPANNQPVASYFVKRAIDKGVRLILIDDQENGLSPLAFRVLTQQECDAAIEMADRAEHPVVLYGTRMAGLTSNALKKISHKATFIPLEPVTNSCAATAFDLNSVFYPSGIKSLYVLLGEQSWNKEDLLLKSLPKSTFIAVQAAYISSLTDRADLVLPTTIWSEGSCSLTNTEGRIQFVNRAVKPAGEAKSDWEVLSLLADKLGKRLGASLEDLSSSAAAIIQERRNRDAKS